MKRRLLIAVAALIILPVLCIGTILIVATNVNAHIPTSYTWQKMASGFVQPTSIVEPPDGSGRLFVTEQTGTIRIIDHGQVIITPFLDIKSKLTSKDSEQGLLDIAFHPKYASNGLFFITYTNPDGNPMLVRYHISADNPNIADPSSAKVLLTIPHPYTNHNGGQLQFGPEGYLYYGMGDGGSGGDPQENGQNKSVLLASMMRLDVDHGDPYAIPPDNPYISDKNARPELWAKGLRNPWRFSFDQQTGDLYIADVGEKLYEEVDFQPANSKGGENYGWNLYESNHSYKGGDQNGLVFPIAEYEHLTGGCAIIGGYVYRGKTLPALVGTYIYGDYCRGTMWSLRRDLTGKWVSQPFMASGLTLTTFGQSSDGELYVADFNGTVYKLIAKQV